MSKPQPPKYNPLAMGNPILASKYGIAMKHYLKRLEKWEEKQMLKCWSEFDIKSN